MNEAGHKLHERSKRSADFQICCIAGFPARRSCELGTSADLEIGDTAGWETCATSPSIFRRLPSVCVSLRKPRQAGIKPDPTEKVAVSTINSPRLFMPAESRLRQCFREKVFSSQSPSKNPQIIGQIRKKVAQKTRKKTCKFRASLKVAALRMVVVRKDRCHRKPVLPVVAAPLPQMLPL
jgi:hypothetical protein